MVRRQRGVGFESLLGGAVPWVEGLVAPSVADGEGVSSGSLARSDPQSACLQAKNHWP